MMKLFVTPKERVLAALQGQQTDRCPVINPTSIATFESMQRTGCYFPNAHIDTDKMIALAAVGHTIVGFDTITPYFSVHLEAAALGCVIDWGSVDELPSVKEYPLKEPGEFRMPANFLDRKPIKSFLSAVRSLKATYGSDVAIVGKVIGPWTLAYHLYGVANLLMDVVIAPEKVRELLHSLKQVPLAFAEAQIAAGADMITWADHVTRDLISPKSYEEFLLPIHRECTGALQGVPLILHVCGNVLDRIHLFRDAGFTAFHLDSRNSIVDALRIMEEKMLLTGNINNPGTLLNGNPEDIKAEVQGIIRDGIRLISPECAIPTRVPNRNLVQIVETAKAARE